MDHVVQLEACKRVCDCVKLPQELPGRRTLSAVPKQATQKGCTGAAKICSVREKLLDRLLRSSAGFRAPATVVPDPMLVAEIF